MSIASDMGFEIGKLYRVINDNRSAFFKNGMIVTFEEDDGTRCPWFLFVSGPRGPRFDKAFRLAIPVDALEPVDHEEIKAKPPNNKSSLLMYVEQHYPDDKVLRALVESI